MSSLPPVHASGKTPDRQALKRWVDDYIDFFERLEPASLDRVEEVFEPSARFSDPFNDVTGPRGIRSVFEHMFESCTSPRFRVTERAIEEKVAYLKWRFTFDSGKQIRSITGVSRVVFGDSGRVLEHEDYWDAAGQVYERLPILGRLLRALRRRLAAPPPGTTNNG